MTKDAQCLQEIETWSPSKVMTIAEHACNHVLKRVLKLSTYQLQIFLVKYEYLRSYQLCENQGIRGKLRKRVCKNVFAILMQLIGGGGERGAWLKLSVVTCFLQCFVEREPQEITRQMCIFLERS